MKQLSADVVKDYALAGNATITLQSGNTGAHFTYKIKRHNTDLNLYFVHLLRGADNENDYTYVGCYYSDNHHFVPVKTYKGKDAMTWPASLRAIRYFFEKIEKIPDVLKVYHEGRCGACGRTLTTPESLERGLGPECAKRC